MVVLAAHGWVGSVCLLAMFFLWLLGGADGGEDANGGAVDPEAPDEHGFIPADKYGYGYGYSWGDPYGDPDL